MKTICVLNNKGGVGKSATVFETASALKMMGYKVLCVDLDEQSSISMQTMTKAQLDEINENSVTDVVTRRCKIKDAIIETDHFDLLKGDNRTRVLDKMLPDADDMLNLKDALDSVSDQYDFCLIDEPAHLGVCAYLGVIATADGGGLLIPTEPDVTTIQGSINVYDFVNKIRRMFPSIKIIGILKIGFKSWNFHKIANQALNKISEEIECPVFKSQIRHCVTLREAKGQHTSVISYSPKCNAAKDYLAFAKELIERL